MSKLLWFIVIVTAAVLVLLACYFIGQRQAITLMENGENTDGAPLAQLYEKVNGYKDGFKTETFLSDPAALMTAVTGAVAVAIPAYAAYSGIKGQLGKAKTDITNLQGQLSNQTESYEKSLQNKETELQSYTKALETQGLSLDKIKTDNAALLENNKTLNTQLETVNGQFDKISNQYKELQKITASDVISQLPNGSTIPTGAGSVLQVIEKKVIG